MHLRKKTGIGILILIFLIFLPACGLAEHSGELKNWHPEDVQDMSVVKHAMIPESDRQKADQAMKGILSAAERQDFISSKRLFSNHFLLNMSEITRGNKLTEQQFAIEYFADMKRISGLSLNDFQLNRFDHRIEYQYMNGLTGNHQLVVFQFIEEENDWKLENYFISKK